VGRRGGGAGLLMLKGVVRKKACAHIQVPAFVGEGGGTEVRNRWAGGWRGSGRGEKSHCEDHPAFPRGGNWALFAVGGDVTDQGGSSFQGVAVR